MRRPWNLNRLLKLIVAFIVLGGCGGHDHVHPHQDVLPPPSSADPVAAAHLIEGNRLFMDHRYAQARAQYEAAITAQPALAEAHYNLAVTLYTQGRFSESRPHYIEAANLAPGHPVIWNAPVFRKITIGETESDAVPSDFGHGGHPH
ncbi:MAG: tetratricopeptide repeat protein [Nitrospirae bacterium]|nr:MAG: tetratricopeptide repeat protein [Nitrospirota bacterium]